MNMMANYVIREAPIPLRAGRRQFWIGLLGTIVVLAVILSAGPAKAGFNLLARGIGISGGQTSSANFNLSSTVGQPLGGPTSSASRGLLAGFHAAFRPLAGIAVPPGFVMRWSANVGGGASDSASFSMNATIGQSIIGLADAEDRAMLVGFHAASRPLAGIAVPTDFVLPWSANVSGGTTDSISFLLNGTLGQSVTGQTNSDSFGIGSGFQGVRGGPNVGTTPVGVPIPSLDPWALAVLAGALAIGLFVIRRRLGPIRNW
jgi:hypothetical protein